MLLFGIMFAFGLAACNGDSSANTFTVTFNTYGGSAIAAVEVEEGELLEKPDDPVKAGYTFVRWNYDFAEYKFDTPVTSDMGLDAVWQANDDTPYSIKVYIQNGNVYEDKTSDYADVLQNLYGTTDETVNVEDKAAEIAAELPGYYFDRNHTDCVYEGTVLGDGSTEFVLYFSKLVVPDEILVGYSEPVEVYTHGEGEQYLCDTKYDVLVDSDFVRDGDISVLRLTAESTNRRFIVNVTPEHQDWSSFDYIGFWIYNDTSADLYSRLGFIRGDGNTVGSLAVRRGEWTFVAVDLEKYGAGDTDQAYPLNAVEAFEIALERNNSGAEITEGSVVYVSNIRGYNFTSTAPTENLVVRFDEPTGNNGYTIWQELTVGYWRSGVEEVEIGGETVSMMKASILQQATSELQQGMLFEGVRNDHATYGSYTFEFYNPNDFAVMVGKTTVAAGEKVTITAAFDDDTMFDSYNRLKIIVKTEDDGWLPAGSAYYVGNIYGVVQQFTVTFDSNEGSTVEPVAVTKGETVAEPTQPTRTGYDFVCWNLNGARYSFDTPITADITLVAVWQLQGGIAYTVNVYVEEDGTYTDQTENFSGVLVGLSGTAGETVNVSDKAEQIAEILGYRYYIDAEHENYLAEAEIAADGSTVFSLYYSVDTQTENIVVGYDSAPTVLALTGDYCGISMTVLTSGEYLREGDISVLQITTTSASARVSFTAIPEYTDWSSYDYIGFWVYNGSDVNMYARNGRWTGLSAPNSVGAIYAGRWNFITIDLHRYQVGASDKFLPLNAITSFAVEFERNNQAGNIAADSVFYVSDVRGYRYVNGDQPNLAARFDEPVGFGEQLTWTEGAIAYWHFESPETIDVSGSSVLTKVVVDQQAAGDSTAGILFGIVKNDSTLYSSYTFEFYNPNDFAVMVGKTTVAAGEKVTITAAFDDNTMFDSYNRLKIIVKTTDGSSYYIGNIYGVPIG